MSSSRSARRRRRHRRYGKPVYPSRPKNGLTPTSITVDEWVNPYYLKNSQTLFGDDNSVQKFRSRLFLS